MQGTAQRPMGITILAVLAILGGALGVLGSLTLFGLGTLGTILGIILLAQSVASLAFGYGAWTLQPWAWTLGVVSYVVSLALSVWSIFQGAPIVSVLISMAIAVAILYYLFTPEITRAFGKA